MKRFFYLLIAAISISTVQGQQQRTCGTHDRYLQAIQNDPSIALRRAQLEKQVQEWISRQPAQRTAGGTVLVTVPVVVHVLNYNNTQAISDAQVLSQIDVLNKDYSFTNSDTGLVPAAFKPRTSNTQIQFCMATVDPSGVPTTGIERRAVTVTRIGNTSRYYNVAQGGLAAWDRNRYLNFWICDIDGGNTLGYTYLPGTVPASYDGVVIDYRYWGTIGTVFAPFNKGRTATHEVGHWFNLEHIWADEPSCSADDYVADTPQQKGENYGCPSYPQTTQSGGRCVSTDPSAMFMNYMDYTDDACMYMFTSGQSARMQAALNTSRASLFTSNGCQSPTNVASIPSLGASVYPNPSSGAFEFSTYFSGDVNVTILDITGRSVMSKIFLQNEPKRFDLTDFPDGVYIVRFESDGRRDVRRIVKN
ncbi:MAG: M43 family zinc metalloprotease [Bacteroidota bacterium]